MLHLVTCSFIISVGAVVFFFFFLSQYQIHCAADIKTHAANVYYSTAVNSPRQTLVGVTFSEVASILNNMFLVLYKRFMSSLEADELRAECHSLAGDNQEATDRCQ